MEPLDRRAHLSTNYWEVEPNATDAQAQSVGLNASGSMTLSGRSFGSGDADTFRLYADRTLTLRVDSTTSGSGATTSIFGARTGTNLLTTTNTGTLYTAAGSSYFIRVRSTSPTLTANYTIRFSLATPSTGAGVGGTPTTTPSVTTVPAQTLWRMQNGVNIPGWFWNLYGPNFEGQMRSQVQQADVDKLKAVGIRSVRVPIDSNYIFDWYRQNTLTGPYLDELRDGINLMLRNGIAVIASPFGEYNKRVTWDPNGVVNFARQFGAFLSQFDSRLLVVQTANEPEGSPSNWWPLQQRVISAYRQSLPNNTILTATTLRAGGTNNEWSTVRALTQNRPYADRNVVYGLHFYEPFPFTHQGAAWATPGYDRITGLTYPSSPGSVQWLVDKLNREGYWTVANQVAAYGASNWNISTIRARLQPVGDWARSWGVPVVVDEFGVFADGMIDPNARDRYLRDVRTTLQSLNLGWNMWDFDQGFGLFGGNATNNRYLRYSTAQALGLVG
jgi:endoglucanase